LPAASSSSLIRASCRSYCDQHAASQNHCVAVLEADEVRKPEFYRAVEDISKKCRPPDLDFSQPDLNDRQIADTTSKAATQMVLERENRQVGDFVTDACATVAVAYHRAAGVYEADADMQELGTAAVHLLTMATSYINAQKE
jgi:hypothetical protein